MSPHDDHLPEELRDVAQQLRANRDEPSGLELDRIKVRAMRRSESPASDGLFASVAARWRSRAVALLLTAGLMLSVTTAGVMAHGGWGSSPQYGKGKIIIIIIIIKPGHGGGHPGGGGGQQYCPPKNKPGHKNKDGDSDCNNGGGNDNDSSSDDSDSRGGYRNHGGHGHDNNDSD